MNKLFSFLKSNLPIFILFLVWLPITFFNTKIYWMLVDDGWDVVFSRTLFEKLSSINLAGFVSQLLETGGRFRPVYWMYHMWVWLIGGNSYQFHHFAHMLVIGITVLFIYLIIKELTHSKYVSFFAALFYLLTPLNTENVFRLGPQEPLLAMFLGITFYLVIKGQKIFLPCLIVILAIFSKETAVAILPVLFFYYIYGKKNKLVGNKKQSSYLWTTACISSVVLILTTFLRRGGYSSNYSFDLSMWFDTLLIYIKELSNNTLYIFPLFSIIYLTRTVARLFKRQKMIASKLDLFEFLFFAGFFCFLVIQLPWKYALTRYLMPSIFFLTLFIFTEVYIVHRLLSRIKLSRQYRQVFKYLLVFAGIYISLIWGIVLIYKEAAYSPLLSPGVFAKMAGYPKNTTILMNMLEGEATIELVYETQAILSEFWGRSDLKVEYLDVQNLPKNNHVVVDSDQFLRKYPTETVDTLYKSEFTSIQGVSRGLVMTTPLGLIKQSMKKLIDLILYGYRLNSNGLYTFYYNAINWDFYYLKE